MQRGQEFSSNGDRLESITHAVKHAAHLLPAQGPIGVFIHHNTLHAFQDLKFEEAVAKAAELFDTEPYMTEDAFRQSFAEGRIKTEDIDAVLASEWDAELWSGMTRRELRRRLMIPGLRRFEPATVQWHLEDGGLLDTPRKKSLFDACFKLVPATQPYPATPARPRDGILARTNVDSDAIIHPFLIRLCAVFLDQGLAYWPMPDRGYGLLRASLTLLQQPGILPDELKTLPARCREIADSAKSPEVAVCRLLDALGVPEFDWGHVIEAELLALPGWAGMVHRLEEEPELAPHERVPASLMEFLALRLLLTLAACDALLPEPAAWLLVPEPSSADSFARRLADAANLMDAASQLDVTDERKLPILKEELAAFDDLERRRIFQLAYERRHERQILLPIAEHRRRAPLPVPDRLSAQVFFCIDEREESIRRHLEEAYPDIETFAAAGFYGIAMNYTGIDDAHGVSLCPVVVKPQHAITERPAEGHWGAFARRTRLRRVWAWMMRHWFVGSRSMVRGWFSTTVAGSLMILPMAARVLSPRRYGRLIDWVNGGILPEPRTELAFERKDAEGHAAAHGLLAGFTVEEKIDRVAGVLGPAGLRKGMARLVVTLGHGSTSLNNPHESAHDCGACGGRRGGPNGRIFAAMANHPAVRAGLRERGILIPEDTWFVGGYHDTCNDNVDLFDTEDVPASHQNDLAYLRAALDEARARSAHERARRFEASFAKTPIAGLHHVQDRAEHLAEPRPEYGHCTNAVTIVGRRSSTRGLFMDRRAFMTSYDASQDPGGDLGRLLGAVIPVCAGISLEYYFSFVDNEGYGCGTKLPHNVTGLLGVMNGYQSDLRTGLPWQMVEIHEPVRQLFVIEATPESIELTIRSNALNSQFLDNRWIRVASMDPVTGEMQMYRDGVWEYVTGDDEKLPTTPSSIDWYSGHLKHLPLARIEATSGR